MRLVWGESETVWHHAGSTDGVQRGAQTKEQQGEWREGIGEETTEATRWGG